MSTAGRVRMRAPPRDEELAPRALHGPDKVSTLVSSGKESRRASSCVWQTHPHIEPYRTPPDADPDSGRRFHVARREVSSLMRLSVGRGIRRALPVSAAAAAALVLIAPVAPNLATAEENPAAADADPAPPSSIVGFVRTADGEYRTIEFPGAATTTYVFGINNQGMVVGAYDDATGRSHGFVRGRSGHYRTIDFPGAYATVATRINDRGQIVGDYYSTKKRFNQGLKRGFLLDHRRFTRINVPGSDSTEAVGLDDHGRVVGETGTLEPLAGSGFLWNDGRIKRIDVPGAAFTGAEEINERDQIAGTYGKSKTSDKTRGYLLDKGRFKTFAVPGGRLTQVFGLN